MSTTTSSPGLADVALAVDVAVSPTGTDVALAIPGNALTRGPQVMVANLASVTAAGADCVMGGGGIMSGAAEVVAVAYTPDGTVVAQTREPATLALSDRDGVISLSTVKAADTGHALFHANAGGGLACASCHPEGGEDGRVWRFACLGPRRTQSLRGGWRRRPPSTGTAT